MGTDDHDVAGEGPCEWGETCCCNAGDQRCKEIEGRAAEDESDHFYIQYGGWAQVWGKSAFLSGEKNVSYDEAGPARARPS